MTEIEPRSHFLPAATLKSSSPVRLAPPYLALNSNPSMSLRENEIHGTGQRVAAIHRGRTDGPARQSARWRRREPHPNQNNHSSPPSTRRPLSNVNVVPAGKPCNCTVVRPRNDCESPSTLLVDTLGKVFKKSAIVV